MAFEERPAAIPSLFQSKIFLIQTSLVRMNAAGHISTIMYDDKMRGLTTEVFAKPRYYPESIEGQRSVTTAQLITAASSGHTASSGGR